VLVRLRGLPRAGDPEVLELANREDRILASADTDFGTILAQSSTRGPSVVISPRLRSALLLAEPSGDHRGRSTPFPSSTNDRNPRPWSRCVPLWLRCSGSPGGRATPQLKRT